MRWFRSTRFVPYLALFALACQFVLAFGHVHLDRISGGTRTSDTGIWAAGSVAMADVGGGAGTEQPGSPVKQPNGIGGDFCAICASLKLASAVLAPASPVVVVPDSYIVELPWSVAAAAPATFDHFLFEARGPPHA
jgi:hypothetical protein